jgi:DNA-binding protein WhiA
MTAADRDLVLALRSELAAIDPARPCDRRAEAIALGGVTVARDAPLARLLLRLARERADQRPPDLAERTGRGARRLDPFDWAAAAEHCRLAWLRGLFLARGSLSLAGGRTHLEFVLAPEDAPLLAARLADVGLPGSWRIRRGRGVVTWKNGERVGLFLRRIGAAAALLELEARQVSRALRGDLNRVINAESANLQRAVGAAGRQVAAIEELAATGELAEQPFVVRAVAEARLETPEATLSELADRLSIHRSAVQRALERIERLSLVAADRPARSRRAAAAPAIPAGRAPLA